MRCSGPVIVSGGGGGAEQGGGARPPARAQAADTQFKQDLGAVGDLASLSLHGP